MGGHGNYLSLKINYEKEITFFCIFFWDLLWTLLFRITAVKNEKRFCT